MQPTRTFRPASLLVLAALLAACSGEAGTAPSGSTASSAAADTAGSTSATAADASSDRPHPPHPGGPDFLIGAALREPINLTADQQKAIEALVPPKNGAGPHPFDPTRVAPLTAAIRAGAIDATTVLPSPPALDDAAMAARRTAAATALTTLHSTLSATQRRALVDAIEQKESERASDDAHPHDGGPVTHMLEGLDVTAAQRQEITSKLDAARPAPPSDADRAAMKADHDAMHAAMKAKLETFASDRFDATAFVTPPAGARKPSDHADRFVADLAIVVSVLTPAQREKLAERIEAGPPDHAVRGRPTE